MDWRTTQNDNSKKNLWVKEKHFVQLPKSKRTRKKEDNPISRKAIMFTFSKIRGLAFLSQSEAKEGKLKSERRVKKAKEKKNTKGLKGKKIHHKPRLYF